MKWQGTCSKLSYLLEHSVILALISFLRNLRFLLSLGFMSSDMQYITLQCFLNQSMPNIEFCTESMREKVSRGIASRGLCKHFMQPPEWLPLSMGVYLLCWCLLQGTCRQLLVKIV